jgi:hypothetical protein
MTDVNGYFTIQTELIPWDAQNVRASVILYAWGPVQYSEMIKISDPAPQGDFTWRNPRDTTIWWFNRAGYPPPIYVTPGQINSFDICFPDTAIPDLIEQPISGAVNIFETYLHARTCVNAPAQPNWPLRVLWEPGYDTLTKYRNDTIFVLGEQNPPINNTDEWDDDMLLHEFGHYLMRHYAQLRATVTSSHAFWLSYPNDTCLAYKEGWASFFSGMARTGLTNDSLIIDNIRGIGSGTAGYLNLENPWNCSGMTSEDFQGGPWCEGAVAGVLWDIYDAKTEIPYHFKRSGEQSAIERCLLFALEDRGRRSL